MSVVRLLLLPFSWLYGAALWVRHALFDNGLLPSMRPSVPTIVIGNLALGGTGKTPMLELALRELQDAPPLATLSRGYGRKSSHLHEVSAKDTAETVGDEPLQIKGKFPTVHVFVGADRVKCIEAIQDQLPGAKAVLLDDAFQHRRLNADLNILLTTFQRPWCDDRLLPAGRLRDLPSRRKAAQIVVVTKCTGLPDGADQKRWRERLCLGADQELFFSGIEYVEPDLMAGSNASLSGITLDNCLLFTGIADPAPLADHARRIFKNVAHVAFPDHHPFSQADLAALAGRYATFAPGPKMLITTEKDAMRLRSVIKGSPLEKLPVGVIGMRAVILNEPERFASLIRDHVATYPAHR